MKGLEEMYWELYVTGFILTGFFSILSILLFFKLHIPKVIGVLTGQTKRVALKNMRNKKKHPSLVTSTTNSTQDDNMQTGFLSEELNGNTTVLCEFETKKSTVELNDSKNLGTFTIKRNITILHTEEVI